MSAAITRRVQLEDASAIDTRRVAGIAATSRLEGRRLCDWCGGPIPNRARLDAICCSTRCRQARHRFRTAVAAGGRYASSVDGLRLAYADPPYPGLSAKYYAEHPDFAGEVDHAELIRSLQLYDGWALSTSAAALPTVLALCPAGVRVAAWHRGARGHSGSGGPANAWEPVIFYGGRVAPAGPTRSDRLVHVSRPRTTDPARVIGSKPATFAAWMFGLLGAQPSDTLDDLYPGSGGIARAWNVFVAQGSPPRPSAGNDA